MANLHVIVARTDLDWHVYFMSSADQFQMDYSSVHGPGPLLDYYYMLTLVLYFFNQSNTYKWLTILPFANELAITCAWCRTYVFASLYQRRNTWLIDSFCASILEKWDYYYSVDQFCDSVDLLKLIT